MLAIRFQRVGRSGHAEYRIIVQEAHRSPTSGKVVARLGHFNPHSKAVTLDKEKASFYLTNGAQPSTRAAVLLKAEGVSLPAWVSIDTSKKRTIKNSDKLRRNRPAEEAPAKAAVEAPAKAEASAEAPAEAATETPAETAATAPTETVAEAATAETDATA